MKRGHIELDIDKVVMFGIAGSGKTCALAVMLGDDPPDVTCSTPLMKRPVKVLFMDVDKKLHWKIKTLQEVNESIAEIIRSRMPKQAAEALVSSASPASPSQEPPHSTSDQSFQPTPEETATTTSEAAREIPTLPKKKPTGTVQSAAEGSLNSNFTMNAAKPGKKDQECAEAIRRCLSKEREGRKGVKVPLRWYALYQKLLQVVVGLGKKVLPREQCGLVAESMEIDEQSCEEALQFFNRLNMLFYFPDILPNLVFMDPQMLLDKVTELVEENYRMSQEKKDQPFCPIQREEMKFRDHGQVTEKFLSKFDSHYEKPLFTPKELITLLRGLLVFADLSEDVYFMPCLLQVKTPEVVAQYQVSGEKALALHFPDSGPLLGMFCSTVAYLLSSENAHPCPWQVVQDEAGTPECLNRNVIQFTIPNVMGTVSLIDHFTHFEIHIHTLPKKAAELWKVAHNAVFAGLKKAGKTLGYTNNTPVPAIVCPAHLATPHPATVEEGGWKCSKMAHIFGSISEDTIPWWSVCSTHSECMYTHVHCMCGVGCALIGYVELVVCRVGTPNSKLSLLPA